LPRGPVYGQGYEEKYTFMGGMGDIHFSFFFFFEKDHSSFLLWVINVVRDSASKINFSLDGAAIEAMEGNEKDSEIKLSIADLIHIAIVNWL